MTLIKRSFSKVIDQENQAASKAMIKNLCGNLFDKKIKSASRKRLRDALEGKTADVKLLKVSEANALTREITREQL
jgi:hypothetical protein